MSDVVIVAEGDGGHRREYIALFTSIFSSAGLTSEVRRLTTRDILVRGALFSPMLEEHSMTFMVVAAVRSLLGRKSAALLFRPTEAVSSNSFKHRLKRLALKALLKLPHTSILTILPFAVDPSFASIARGWIYDPQLWDISSDRPPPVTPIVQDVLAAASGRKLIVALGAQNAGKGFNYLVDLWTCFPELRSRMLFVAAGKVDPQSATEAQQFVDAGGMLINRFISDDELLGLYGAADMIWACYAPFYNQASGVFGRAVQLEIPAIVRAGSQVEKLSELLDHPTTALPWGDSAAAVRQLQTPTSPRPPAQHPTDGKALAMRKHSISTLGGALGTDLLTIE